MEIDNKNDITIPVFPNLQYLFYWLAEILEDIKYKDLSPMSFKVSH
jgi:hypothetical protein